MAIEDHFQSHLLRNKSIRKNDAIAIFYAGHGTRVNAPENWITSDGKVEIICPYDEGTPDVEDKEMVPGIPTFTLNGWLRQLSNVKGGNIVRSLLHSSFYIYYLIATIHSDLDRYLGVFSFWRV
jgi:hypothetical protein